MGQGSQTAYSSRVDIYDAIAKSWSQAELSQPRGYLAAATHKGSSRIYFAGGFAGRNFENSAAMIFSDRVDVYDTSTSSWSLLTLSVGRGGESFGYQTPTSGMPLESLIFSTDLAGAAIAWRNMVVFAGGTNSGGSSDVIDVYDEGAGSWSTERLSMPRSGLRGATVGGNYSVFVGGMWADDDRSDWILSLSYSPTFRRPMTSRHVY